MLNWIYRDTAVGLFEEFSHQSEPESTDDSIGEHQDRNVRGKSWKDKSNCSDHAASNANWKENSDLLEYELPSYPDISILL